jgi:MFS family permease
LNVLYHVVHHGDKTVTPLMLSRMHGQVLLLSGAQALFQTASVMVMTVGGLAGGMIASRPELATMPIAAMFLGTATVTFPASLWMARAGRRAGFVVGALLGACGGVAAAAGVWVGSLPSAVVRHLPGGRLSGLYAGGTTLLTTTYTAAERGRAQATNDMTIFAVGLACSFSAAALLQALGWQLLNILLIPWLALASASFVWLGLSRRRRRSLPRGVAMNERAVVPR